MRTSTHSDQLDSGTRSAATDSTSAADFRGRARS